jgi:hypothetical protein
LFSRRSQLRHFFEFLGGLFYCDHIHLSGESECGADKSDGGGQTSEI